ncbi:MAG: ATP-binding cassette domain-containing protein [Nocardioidaceae bacterium]
MDESGLVAHGIGVSGPDAPLLADVSLTAVPGRILAVTGSSGSGKTTLLSVLGGLVSADSGTAQFDGGPVGTRHGEPRPGTAFVLQTYGLVPTLTAEENVAIALRARKVAPLEASRRAAQVLERVGIGDLVERMVQELSGGQVQRVAVARALAVAPDVLLADEPTSELDEKNRDLVVGEIRAEADRGAVVVLATHDPEVASMCDDELHLVDGRMDGDPVRTIPTAEDGPGHEHDMFRKPSGGPR